MKAFAIVLIIFGIGFLIYSIISRNKLNIYNRSDKFTVINEKGILKLQLYISIINSFLLIFFGATVILYELRNLIIVGYPLVFHLINYTTILVSRHRKYIEYK